MFDADGFRTLTDTLFGEQPKWDGYIVVEVLIGFYKGPLDCASRLSRTRANQYYYLVSYINQSKLPYERHLPALPRLSPRSNELNNEPSFFMDGATNFRQHCPRAPNHPATIR